MSYQILGVTVDIVILYVTIQWKAILYVISDTGCDSRHSHSICNNTMEQQYSMSYQILGVTVDIVILYVTIQWKAILYVISDTGCDSRHSHSICNNTMESNTLCHIRYWV